MENGEAKVEEPKKIDLTDLLLLENADLKRVCAALQLELARQEVARLHNALVSMNTAAVQMRNNIEKKYGVDSDKFEITPVGEIVPKQMLR